MEKGFSVNKDRIQINQWLANELLKDFEGFDEESVWWYCNRHIIKQLEQQISQHYGCSAKINLLKSTSYSPARNELVLWGFKTRSDWEYYITRLLPYM
jgi:hypothetical protein